MALTQAQERLLQAARRAAKELGLGGRELTPLIGELTACQKMDLMWEPSDGYDARSGEFRVQIKARKSWTTPEVNPAGRLGRFGRNKGYLFDVAMYIELDDNFNTAGLWRMGVDQVEALEEAEAAKRGLHVRTFRGQAGRLD